MDQTHQERGARAELATPDPNQHRPPGCPSCQHRLQKEESELHWPKKPPYPGVLGARVELGTNNN